MKTTPIPPRRSLLRTYCSNPSLLFSQKPYFLVFLLWITCLLASSINDPLSAQCFPCVPGSVNNENDDPWSGECYLNATCGLQGNPCQANDVTLTGIFIADSLGNPVAACSIGEEVTVLLWGNFSNNTGTDRYAVRTNTEVWSNNECLIELNSCSFDVLSAGTTAQSLVGTFTYTCGQTIELRNTWIAWETQSAQCLDPGGDDYISVCGEYAPSKCSRNFEILEFLAPNFSYDCGVSTPTTTEVCFDDFTMGGVPPLEYDWDFGDGGTSTLQSPCHTYNATTGTFTVELTVTDSNGTIAGAVLEIDLDSLECCEMAAICPPANGGFFVCPEDVPAPDTNLVVIIDSCASVITFVQHDTLGSGCGLDTMTLVRRYIFSDGNNLDTCTQTFKVTDDVPPVFTCPAAISVQCASLVPPSDPSLIVGTDNCDGNTITTFVGDVISGQTCANRYTITRTYRVSDECLNSATCTQTISVFDNTAPQMTCPSAVLVQCASQVPAPNPASVTSTDNCGGSSTITHVGDVTSNQTCANRLTITRTYRATDACGNSATCTQTISVFDNTAPSLTCPGTITVSCSNQVPMPNPASVTSTDNCGGSSTITFVTDVVTNMTCADQFTVTRTYRATDACGNSATCAQTILVNDQTPPSITCPPNVTVQCANLLPAPNPGSVTSSDNCGGSPTVTHAGDVVSNMTCTNRFTVTRTYRATDACGHSASCTQVITVFDNTGPSITCPPNVTVQCANLVPSPNILLVTATDNCGGTVTITHVGDVNSMATCVNRFNITRTYRALDDCGNSSSCTQVISVFDNTPPVLTCPGTISVQCAGDIPTPNPASVTATDNCGGTATVTFLTGTVTNQVCANRFTLIRTYMATDDCGNTGTCNQSIVVFDNTPPSVTCPPDNITVACTNLIPLPDLGSITATDNCGGAILVTSQDIMADSTCANQLVIVRTYTAADVCGNSASCTQTITVFDNTSPTIFCPANVSVACANMVPDAEPLIVIATDNCGGTASVSHQGDDISNQTCANRFTLTRTYLAIDECGNSASCTQTITVNDVIAPIVTCPLDVTIESGSDTSPQNTGMPMVSDNCGAIPVITSNDVTIAGDCQSDYIIQRTWSATDECGNSATCLQIIGVIGECDVDLSLIKEIDAGQGPIGGGDNVNFTITVTNEGLLPVGSITVIDYIPLGFSLNDADWTAGIEGSTGQSASITLSIANGALSPGGLLPAASVSVQITLQADSDISIGLYENVAEITAVFDVAGNDVTNSDVDSDPDTDDTNDPEAEDDHDPVLICIQATPVITGSAFICGGETATYSVLNFNPTHIYEWLLLVGGGNIIEVTDSSIVVQWTANAAGPFIVQITETAGPGCVSVATLVINIQGAEPIACIDHINLSIDNECGTVVLSGLILLGEQAGNDSYEVVIMYMNGDTVPNATFTCEHIGQTFKVAVTSECSGQSCWGLVTVEDKLPPIIDCVCPLEDSCTIDCRQIQQFLEGTIPDSLRPEVIDNCCGTTTLVTTNIDVDFASCGGGFVRVDWLATDASGNIATCSQQFDIVPLTLDSLTFPPDFEGECGESSDPSVTGWPQIDGVDLNFPAGVCNLYVTYRDIVIDMCGGGIKIIRTWTVIDWCTSTTSVFPQQILLIDHLGPVLTCVEDFTIGTDVWFCYANVIVPRPIAIDACSAIKSYSLSSPEGTVVNIGPNAVINGLPIGTHTVIWTVTDECFNTSTCSIDITVIDNVPPVVNCQAHTIVSLTSDRPNGITLIPAAVFNDGSFDNCGPVTFRARRMDSCIDFDWTTEGACVDDIPGGVPPINNKDYGIDRGPCVPFGCCDVDSGPIMVELEVTDEAGNVNYCMVEVEVQDKLSPSIECPPTIFISCGFLLDIEEGTFRDVEGNNDGTLDEDPLSELFGNVLDASRHNQTEREAIIINDPDNTDFLQPHLWGIDGWATDNCEIELEVSVRVIDDCSGASFPGQAPQGAVRLIERRFRAFDGITAGSCVQRIWVIDYTPFFITDSTCNNANPFDGVIWPCDVMLTTCPDNLGGLPGPVIIEDGCSIIGTNFEDTRYDFADSACYKVLREWQIIDWCQFDPETGYGLWSYVQEIRVMDLIDPEFENCPLAPLELCTTNPGISVPDNNQIFLGENDPNSSSCSVHVTMSQEIHEDCSESIFYDVKIYPFNGTSFIQMVPTTQANLDPNHDVVISFDTEQSTIQSIQQNGLPYNSPLCGDYHRVVWTVEDGCGNINFCDYLFRLEDCKAPTPVCIDGISSVLMGPDGEVTIWASDFDASSVDDCTPSEELLFSFSGATYQPSFTYTCNNVPEFGEEIEVEIWVADGGADQNCNGTIEWSERNKTFCTTHIIITDNEDICGQQQTMLTGEILTDHAEAVQQVIVNLSSPQHLFPAYTTSVDGKFAFASIPTGLDYTITPERNDDYKNGVSTLDLVKIQKHLLGRELMTSPYQFIAADANNSRSLSAVDLVELRKLILGLYTELPNNDSWRFMDKNFVMSDPTNPWIFDESVFVQQWPGTNTDIDFIAIKIGDVNNTVKANALQILPRNGNRIMSLMAEMKENAKQGEIIEMKLTFPEIVNGFQWTLESEGVEFVGVSSGDIQIDESNVGIFKDGITTMSWNGEVLSDGKSKDIMSIIIRWKVISPELTGHHIRLTSLITPAESYTPDDEILQVKLVYPDNEASPEFALYQNKPNPWNGQTIIGFDMPEDAQGTLTLFDATGKVLKVVEGNYKTGYNSVTLTSLDLPYPGVIYYRLESGEYSAHKKMVLIR